jgi:hypothetical protein
MEPLATAARRSLSVLGPRRTDEDLSHILAFLAPLFNALELPPHDAHNTPRDNTWRLLLCKHAVIQSLDSCPDLQHGDHLADRRCFVVLSGALGVVGWPGGDVGARLGPGDFVWSEHLAMPSPNSDLSSPRAGSDAGSEAHHCEELGDTPVDVVVLTRRAYMCALRFRRSDAFDIAVAVAALRKDPEERTRRDVATLRELCAPVSFFQQIPGELVDAVCAGMTYVSLDPGVGIRDGGGGGKDVDPYGLHFVVQGSGRVHPVIAEDEGGEMGDWTHTVNHGDAFGRVFCGGEFTDSSGEAIRGRAPQQHIVAATKMGLAMVEQDLLDRLVPRHVFDQGHDGGFDQGVGGGGLLKGGSRGAASSFVTASLASTGTIVGGGTRGTRGSRGAGGAGAAGSGGAESRVGVTGARGAGRYIPALMSAPSNKSDDDILTLMEMSRGIPLFNQFPGW